MAADGRLLFNLFTSKQWSLLCRTVARGSVRLFHGWWVERSLSLTIWYRIDWWIFPPISFCNAFTGFSSAACVFLVEFSRSRSFNGGFPSFSAYLTAIKNGNLKMFIASFYSPLSLPLSLKKVCWNLVKNLLVLLSQPPPNNRKVLENVSVVAVFVFLLPDAIKQLFKC